MPQVVVSLSISPDQLQRWYAGNVRDVLAYARDGRKVRFPVSVLRPHVTHQGVQGHYAITFDDSNRFQKLVKVG